MNGLYTINTTDGRVFSTTMICQSGNQIVGRLPEGSAVQVGCYTSEDETARVFQKITHVMSQGKNFIDMNKIK